MNLRRLDAESLRDAVITVSGQSDSIIGGPPVMLKTTTAGLQTVTSQNRRSLYLLARRSNPATFMRVFDYPVIDVNCTRRSSSATPLQSLTMINSEYLTVSADRLSARLDSLTGSDAALGEKIKAAFWLTLARGPSDIESAASAEHIETLRQLHTATGVSTEEASKRSFANFVHMLLCSNEFLYVD